MAPEQTEMEPAWSRLGSLPALVVLLGLVLTISSWGYLVLDRREQIQTMAAHVAAQSRRTVATSVRNQISALRNLAGFWAVVGRRPVEEWRAVAEMLIGNHRGLDYIAWIYPDGRRARVAAGRYESPDEIRIEPGEATRLGKAARLIGPEPDASGAWTMRVLLPVRRGDSDLGVLEARVRLRPLLEEALQDSAPEYTIEVHWDEHEIYVRGDPSEGPGLDWWTQQGPVRLPFETTWTATHAPTSVLAAAWLDPALHYLLGAGILLSLLLGFLTHQLRLTSLHARFLSAGKEALEESAGELRQLNEILEAGVSERTRELEAFTHSISHDLKSPLGAILNFSAILELDYQDKLDDEGREAIRRIRSSAERGTDLLDGLLRLSRAGHADLRMTKIDMNGLMQECFALARQSDLDPDPDLEFHLEPLPEAFGDETLIREALVNLFDNALKYSRSQEKRRVDVRGRSEGEHVVYEIQDNGQGFEMRFADKLFGLFQRLPSSSGIEGTGVGLALVARIIDRHGGTVSAEGRVGEGAKIVFTLPRNPTNR